MAKLLASFCLCLVCFFSSKAFSSEPPAHEFSCPPALGAGQAHYSKEAILKKSCDILGIYHAEDACKLSEFQSLGTVGDCEYFGATYDSGDERITASAVFAHQASSPVEDYYFLTVNDMYEATHDMPEIIDTQNGPVLTMIAYNGNAMFNNSSYYHWHDGIWHSLDNKEDLDQAMPENSNCMGTDIWPDFQTMTVEKTFYSKDDTCPSASSIISFEIKNEKFVKAALQQ